MNDKILEFNNVTFSYDTENNDAPPAVRNISLTVKRGEFVAVLGHNGSGKSTLAKLANAILVPTSGKVLAAGLDTSDESLLYDIRSKVGMVFQNPDNQIVATIVEDDVAFGPENLGIPPDEIRARVDDALRSVGMYEFRTREPYKLSGGQKQRVAIAGIIAMRTDCIVLDEPTAMLDPRGRDEVIKSVKKLNKDMGITGIFITHFMSEAVEADRVIVMDNGSILLDGTPREVFGRVDLLEKSGLGVPQAAKLCDCLRSDGFDIPRGILTAEDCIEALAGIGGAR